MAEQMRFDGQVAIISGAGRGLGRQYALALSARGARVVVNNRTRPGQDPATDVVREIRAGGGEATVNHVDVAAPDAGSSLVDAALQTYGSLDIVVANAGVIPLQGRFIDTTSSSLEEMLRVHVIGTYSLVRAAWPHLVEQDYGRIVTTGSASGLYGQPGSFEYSAAKGAITGLTLALAHESRGTGIRINLLSPAGFTTPNERLDVDEQQKAVFREWLDPALVAPAVVWLAHSSCPFNGRMFSAGGGHMGRIAIGESEGFWTAQPTPEVFASHQIDVENADALVFHDDAVSWGGWVAALAGQHRTHAE
jgi:NAD(P)-dependent dehydrogenase (short-subunit alcohol dehydrogenase family)